MQTNSQLVKRSDIQIITELAAALREIAGDAEFVVAQRSGVFSPKAQLREVAKRARAVLTKFDLA